MRLKQAIYESPLLFAATKGSQPCLATLGSEVVN